MGIHGDSEIVAWSTATVYDTPLDQALPPTSLNRNDVYNDYNDRKQRMIRGKGKTTLGIGSLIARICQAIISDNGDVGLISHFQSDWGCCFSLPAVLGKAGISKTLDIPLSSPELDALGKSTEELKGQLAQIYEEKQEF